MNNRGTWPDYRVAGRNRLSVACGLSVGRVESILDAIEDAVIIFDATSQADIIHHGGHGLAEPPAVARFREELAAAYGLATDPVWDSIRGKWLMSPSEQEEFFLDIDNLAAKHGMG